MIAPAATCSHHPLREAAGICVRCRAAMCSDCITKIDGINHCRSCLEALARAQATSGRGEVRVPPWLAVSVGLAALFLLSWLTLEVVMPGKASP